MICEFYGIFSFFHMLWKFYSLFVDPLEVVSLKIRNGGNYYLLNHLLYFLNFRSSTLKLLRVFKWINAGELLQFFCFSENSLSSSFKIFFQVSWSAYDFWMRFWKAIKNNLGHTPELFFIGKPNYSNSTASVPASINMHTYIHTVHLTSLSMTKYV